MESRQIKKMQKKDARKLFARDFPSSNLYIK